MCGELDDEQPTTGEDLHYDRFLVHARAILARAERGAKPDDPLIAAIDELFTAALSRAVRDCEGADPSRRYAMLSLQPLVFARLAGLLAGHLSIGEDPLRKTMEALMHGYAEADSVEPDHGHDHAGGSGHFGHSH
jgi:hypothetical protein